VRVAVVEPDGDGLRDRVLRDVGEQFLRGAKQQDLRLDRQPARCT
jgi:hypothetical protein